MLSRNAGLSCLGLKHLKLENLFQAVLCFPSMSISGIAKGGPAKEKKLRSDFQQLAMTTALRMRIHNTHTRSMCPRNMWYAAEMETDVAVILLLCLQMPAAWAIIVYNPDVVSDGEDNARVSGASASAGGGQLPCLVLGL